MTLVTHGSSRAPLDGTATADRDRLGVLETKLTPPFPRRGLVVRHALLERLDGIDEPVVVVLAPAGYGKSILLSQWAFRAGHPVAWLSADERDNDPATLLRGIAAALSRAVGIDRSVIDGVTVPGPSIWSTAVPRLGAALAASPTLTLCIDDVDRIGVRESLDVLITLAGYLGPGSRLGMAGRGTGDFPLARLVSRGQVASVGRDALALDLGETHAVVGAAGASMSTDEIAALHEQTEGWAAGIYLSALAARGRSGPPDRQAPLPDPSDRLVEDYLRTEILASTSPDDTDLLLRASVLERVSGPLCDAVLDRSGSARALDRLERSNLFLIPLDVDRTWFRFHHLLADLLRAELSRREPDAARAILRRAAAWHEEQGLLEPALEYAIAGADPDRAAGLLARLSQDTFNAGRTETIRRWFDWFEALGTIPDHPRLAGMAVVMFAFDGDHARSDRWWAKVGLDQPDETIQANPMTVFARAIRCRDGVARMHADADLALATMRPDDTFRIAASAARGIAMLLESDVFDAEAALTEAVESWERDRSTAHFAAVLCLTHLAAIAMDRGDWTQAGIHARRARSITLAHHIDGQAAGAAAAAVNARVALHRGAVEQARADATHARRLRMLLSPAVPHVAIRVRLDLIRVDLALGDGGGARTLLAEVREILAKAADMGSLVTETAELEGRVAQMRGGVVSASTLTLAELRLLPLLTTHLSFREIGERLFVSQNTVKTQAISIYRKLDATSRSEAVARASELGLLDWPVGAVTVGG